MSPKKEDIQLNHDYDGIRELDNDLPSWWLYLFYFTIAFAVVYFVYFQVTKAGPSQAEEYLQEMNPESAKGFSFGYHSPYYKKDDGVAGTAAVAVVAEAAESETITPQEEPQLEALTDEASLKEGKAVYTTNCAACHGANGQGFIGPNFTDQYWIHGGSINDIVRIINVGVPAKGMIPWDKTLTPDKIHQVASYILSLQGTNPPNGKAPEGELYVGK